ncbi:hypothetical protein [Amycolatopsis plumensis]|uniref:DUF4259 domain-containing protein n=1 Tax=Amycolatopsis plumensis TaxID=236508 RepID=A0ABV5UDB6_9PSEU
MDSGELRGAVLDALQGFWAPMLLDDLAMVLALEHGVDVDEETLSALAAADHADFAAGVERPVWLCPALEYRDGEANDEFLTRSDWPVTARVVREVLSESQELWLLKQFLSIDCRTPSPHLDRLNERIHDLSVHLPPERIAEKKADPDWDEETDDLELWWMLAEDLHGELRRHEKIAEAGAIGALEALPRSERYFGT